MDEVPPKVKIYAEVTTKLIQKTGNIQLADNIFKLAKQQMPEDTSGLSPYEYGRQLEEAVERAFQMIR